jgi:pachytene checkpoint protein 2
VLTGLDHLATARPGALVLTATNFLRATDDAFLSRADLVLELPLPGAAARAQILAIALAGLWPELKPLAADDALHSALSRSTTGWDGRRLRKLPLRVVGADPQLAQDPGRLTAAHLRAAVAR